MYAPTLPHFAANELGIARLLPIMKATVPHTLKAEPPLPNDQILKLLKRVKRGGAAGREARELIIKHNIRLVWNLANKRSTPDNPDFDDLVSEGLDGLNCAIDRFNIKHGAAFSTYAVYWIRQRMQRWWQNNGRTIRLPVHMHHMKHRHDAATTDESQSETDIMNRSGLTADQIQRVRSLPTVSNIEAIENGYELIEDIAAEPSPDSSIDPARLLDTLKRSLNKRQLEVVTLRYGLSNGPAHSLRQIGKRLHVTGEYVRQILAEAHRKLKTNKEIASFIRDLDE